MSERNKPRRRISYDKDFQEFIPCSSQARSCAKTLTDNSVEDGNRPLDEIALLKRGFLEKESYNRRMIKGPGPLTPQEVMQRGIQLSNGQVVYAYASSATSSSKSTTSFQSTQKASSNGSSKASSKSSSKASTKSTLPPQPIRYRPSPSSKSSQALSKASNSSLTSEFDFFETALNETVYDVGLPEEKATLKMSDTATGKRYELKTDEGHIVLQNAAKSKFLLITRD